MSDWRRVTCAPDSGSAATDLVWFADDPAATETWAYGYPAPDADERAARDWATTAQAAAEAVGDENVQVEGDGVLAHLVRLALTETITGSGPRPDAVLETTGTTAGIGGALAAVRPGGRVLLAARPLDPTTPLPAYRAIHLPGVRVLPVPWRDGVGDAPEHLVACALRCTPWMNHRRAGGCRPRPPESRRG
ncbi:hypothetical protein AB0I22_15870 [Streptomyces sp. NPDC050610]|uniref:hypothetical protein n=1 Tax=Streptomyces sp. NPDC050610 TaxID=3157097 RepID=UPI00341558AD